MTENIDYGQPDFRMEEISEPESNHPVLAKLKLELQEAIETRDKAMSLSSERFVQYQNKTNELKELLTSLIEDEEIEFSVANRIADVFGMALTKRIEIDYQITARVTIEVPVNADEDDVASEVYADRVDFSCYNSDYEVLETDYDVEDWNVRS